MQDIQIGRNSIGDTHPVYIIAELSCNHQQKFEIAEKSIEAIAKSGANAVKSQVYKPETITIESSKKYFQIGNTDLWDGQTLHNLYKEAYTPWEWLPRLQKIANKLGLDFFASAFDPTSVELLESMNVPAYKVASLEIHDLPLIKQMAATMKPIIISTGIATKKDILAAVNTCRKVGNNKIIVLKCSSAYPTPLDEVNLKVIPDLKKRFRVQVGLSDHTLGTLAATTSVGLGSCVIEKHFILDKKLGGPDVEFSLDEKEFNQLVIDIRNTEKMLGTVTYVLSDKQKNMSKYARSLFVVEDINKGEVFTHTNVRSIRPSSGMHPKELPHVIGKKAKQNIEKGTPLHKRLIV